MNESERERNSVPDLPLSAETVPDEHRSFTYSHDYPNDTTMEYSRNHSAAELRMTFTSEDPDMGTEELHYYGQHGEPMEVLAQELRDEISSHLDQGEAHPRTEADSIHSIADFYDDYSHTALYAFENMLNEVTLEKEPSLTWQPIPSEKSDWLYSDSDKDAQRGCIGHLRGDFGRSGTEFWTSWFDHQRPLKQAVFMGELQAVVDALRQPDGLLSSFSAMKQQCHDGTQIRGSAGFHAESKQYEYCLRCSPIRGDYNFYIYCYDKRAQREQTIAKSSVKEQLKVQPDQAEPTKHKTQKEMEI